jgi:hypothetical protein
MIFIKSSRNENGAINEFLGFIIFLMVVFLLILPLFIELMLYTTQAQEVDRITKMAAKRACSLVANPNIGVGGDLGAGGLGAAIDISVMQPMVNSVFKNETAHPAKYFENTPDGQNIDLEIFDYRGNKIDISPNSPNWREVEDSEGNKGRVLLVGVNTEGAVCPSGGGKSWDWCLKEGSDDAIKQQVAKTGRSGQADDDLVQRMQRFQAGRCLQGERGCKDDFVGRIDRCTVCATKTRQSIFAKQGFFAVHPFGLALACNSKDDKRVLPCAINACANERLSQMGGKRGQNRAYQESKNLGKGTVSGNGADYNAAEINFREAQRKENTISREQTDTSWHRQKSTGQGEGTSNLFKELNDQFDPIN